MTNTRFMVETADVDANGNAHVGWVIRDSFSGSLVRNGKEEIVFVDGSNVTEVAQICEQMNKMTAGIEFLDSSVHDPTDSELALLAA